MPSLALSISLRSTPLYSGLGAYSPSLLLDFTDGNQTLDSRITFTRTSNATVTGPNGVLGYAPHNLVTYSEQFDNAAWIKLRSSVTPNTIVAPNGTLTADALITDTTANDTHRAEAGSIAFTSGTTYTLTLYVKAQSSLNLQLVFLTTAFGTTLRAAYNLQTGQTLVSSSSITAKTTDVGNGWFRCEATATATATATSGFHISLINLFAASAAATTFTGDGTSGIYIWGAQLNVGALQPYYLTTATAYYGPRFDYSPTTLAPLGLLIEEQRTNLFTYSEMFSDAIWGKNNGTLTANTLVAPDDTLTADLFFEDTTNASHFITHNLASNFTSGTAYTQSYFVKAKGRTRIQLGWRSDWFPPSVEVNFDLVAKTATPSANATASIQEVGNGWFRITATATADATGTSASDTFFYLADASGNISYTGDGTSGVYIWGAQLEAGAFATSYIPTVASQVTRTADNASMTGTNFSSWYNAAEGTLYADYRLSDPTNHAVAEIGSGGTNYIRMRYASGGSAQYVVQVAGVNQASLAPAGFSTPNIQYKRAITYATNSFNQAINGLLPTAEDTSGTVPVSTRLFIGAEGATGAALYLGGTIRRIAYYPRRLSNAELQGITS